MKTSTLYGIIKETTKKILSEGTYVTDRLGKTTYVSNEDPTLSKDLNVKSATTTSGKKLKEMARNPVLYSLSSDYEEKLKSLPKEILDSKKKMYWINTIISKIKETQPINIIKIANDLQLRQQAINPYFNLLRDSGVIERTGGAEYATEPSSQADVPYTPGDDEMFTWGSDEPKEDPSEREPNFDRLPKREPSGQEISSEDADPLMDYLDSIERVNRLKLQINNYPKEARIYVQQIMKGNLIDKKEIDRVNKKYAGEFESEGNIIRKVYNLYTLKHKFENKVKELETNHPNLAIKKQTDDQGNIVKEVMIDRFQKLANIK